MNSCCSEFSTPASEYLSGRVTSFFETDLAGVRLRAPEHHGLQRPATPAGVGYEETRSGGFEGMAATPDGWRIRAMLTKPLLDADGHPEGRFTSPFFTIESGAKVNATTIMVGNDNNQPFSPARFLQRPDDSEFILLSVPELLNAR